MQESPEHLNQLNNRLHKYYLNQTKTTFNEIMEITEINDDDDRTSKESDTHYDQALSFEQ